MRKELRIVGIVFVCCAGVLLLGCPKPQPVPQFTANVTTGDAPLTVEFTDLSVSDSQSKPILTWFWDFGDGGTSTDQNPTYIYTEPGVYTVALTVATLIDAQTETKVGYINVTSQRWTFTFGHDGTDDAWGIVQTPDRGYVVGGATTSFGAGGSDMCLVRAGADGVWDWYNTYGDVGNEEARSVRRAPDGGYVLCGWTDFNTAGGDDMYFVKTDSGGTQSWEARFGGLMDDRARDVQPTTDGGYILAGRTRSFGAGGSDMYLVKTLADGSETWAFTFGLAQDEDCWAIQQTADEGYILAGSSMSVIPGRMVVYVVKTHANGMEDWTYTLGVAGQDQAATAVQQTADGGYILAGWTTNGAGGRDMFLVKLDTTGAFEWQSPLGDVNDDEAHAVEELPAGGYALAGHTRSYGAVGQDMILMFTDAAGNATGYQLYGDVQIDVAWAMVRTMDTGYALVGRTTSFGVINGDMYIVKTDPNGLTLP
ncbi:MAG: PKD domain-containing protein [bacterium]|nr:PKD domain-containing protein [bacterium]